MATYAIVKTGGSSTRSLWDLVKVEKIEGSPAPLSRLPRYSW